MPKSSCGIQVKCRNEFKKSVGMEDFACASFHIFVQEVFGGMAVEMSRFFFFIVDISFQIVQRCRVYRNVDRSIKLSVTGRTTLLTTF